MSSDHLQNRRLVELIATKFDRGILWTHLFKFKLIIRELSQIVAILNLFSLRTSERSVA